MVDDIGAAIAARAASHIGVPFRLKGRSAVGGFDCVGLVADAISVTGQRLEIPADYSLRGTYANRVIRFFDRPGWRSQTNRYEPFPGDILLLRTAPQQLHLAVKSEDGLVHAHAGIGRIVETPLPSPWPIIDRWRYIGD